MKLEINMIAKSAKEAGEYYKSLFGATLISSTNLQEEMNETIIKIGGVEIRILNENKDYGLVAPTGETINTMWINLIVDDINEIFDKISELNCTVISPITQFKEMNAVNGVLKDKYNYIWVINQKM